MVSVHIHNLHQYFKRVHSLLNQNVLVFKYLLRYAMLCYIVLHKIMGIEFFSRGWVDKDGWMEFKIQSYRITHKAGDMFAVLKLCMQPYATECTYLLQDDRVLCMMLAVSFRGR